MVDFYEKIWLWLASLMIGVFVAAVIIAASSHAVQPPSHVETIDPTRVRIEGDFAKPRVEIADDGAARVIGLSSMFRFEPDVMRVKAGKKITFRLTSPDVVHGFQIVGTNANVMVVPGYVSQFSIVLDKPGEYLVVCNEYCGLAHHLMSARLIVE
jgi:cytochrome c oxidase subunit II